MRGGCEQVIVVDLTHPELGVPVAKVIVPGRATDVEALGMSDDRVRRADAAATRSRAAAAARTCGRRPRSATCWRALREAASRRIAIIDGYFERMAAVWHKEILLALERGIAVWGAASMGALRAAELAPFGMIGVGAIYRAFARGALDADDEVAVAHLPAEHGYRARLATRSSTCATASRARRG